MAVSYSAWTLAIEEVLCVPTVVGNCAWLMSTTPALEVVMTTAPALGAFVSAVGAFTRQLAEWSIPVCQVLAVAGLLA